MFSLSVITRAFFLGGRRGTRTPKHFVNITGEIKNFKMLDFPLNKLQILSLTVFIFSDLNYKVVIFLSETESTPKLFFRKKALVITNVLTEITIWNLGSGDKGKLGTHSSVINV
jgi:hypothetical protein